MKKKIFNLICVNELLNVVSCEPFNTVEDAANQMEIEAKQEYDAFINDYGNDASVSCEIDKDGCKAEVTCDNGEPQTYVWSISEIEV